MPPIFVEWTVKSAKVVPMSVGCAVGVLVMYEEVVTKERRIEGAAVGPTEGTRDGVTLGVTDGTTDGTADGVTEGITLGVTDGVAEGAMVVGDAEGAIMNGILKEI